MTKKLYKLNFDCGNMGDLEGLFIAEEEQVNEAIGRNVNFGEALGKYSAIEGEIEEDCISVVDVSEQTVIDLFNIFGENISGYNPLDHIEYYCKSCTGLYTMDEISYISNENAICDYCIYREVKMHNEKERNKI